MHYLAAVVIPGDAEDPYEAVLEAMTPYWHLDEPDDDPARGPSGGGLSLTASASSPWSWAGSFLRALSRGTARRRAVALGWAGGGTLLAGGALGLVGSVVLPLAGGVNVGVGVVVTFGAVNTFSTVQGHRQKARF